MSDTNTISYHAGTTAKREKGSAILSMDNENYPPFAEALGRFHDFLLRQGVSSEIIWIFREDIVERQKQTYIRVPIDDQISLVESLYTVGRERRLGIWFAVYCFLEERPCCYLCVPNDRTDAQYSMMPDSLKFSVPLRESRRVAIPVRSHWGWMWHKLVQNPIAADELLPRRSKCPNKCGPTRPD